MGTGCTVRRRCTEKWLTASGYLIYQALWCGSSVEVCLGTDILAQGAQKTAAALCKPQDRSALTQPDDPMPVPTPNTQNKLLDNEL